MTHLTARELIESILRSLAATRATFEKNKASADGGTTVHVPEKEDRPLDEPADPKNR
jgi:hypothetical protein